MMKRMVGILMAAVLVIGCVGCGSDSGVKSEQESVTESAESTTSNVETEDKQGEYVDLEWFLTYSALPSEWNMDESIFRGITEATGVRCSMNIPAEDPNTKLNLLMVDGNLPDLVTTDNTAVAADMIDAGLVWDMEELLQTYCPDSHLLTEFPEDVKEAYKDIQGGWYAVTSHISSDSITELYGYPTKEIEEYYTAAQYDDRHAIFFYKPYVDQLGIDPEKIETEADLMEVLAKINDAHLVNESGAEVYTLMVNGTNSRFTSFENTLANTFGAMRVSDEGTYQDINYSEEYRDAMEFLNHCAQLGYITETHLTMDERTVVNICNSGRAACFIGALTTLNSGEEVEHSWLSAGTVVSDNGAKPVLGHSSGIYTGWLYTMVSKDTKYPEACAKYLDFMTSKEGMLLHMYGIEGTDYTWDEQGCLHRTDEGAAKIEDSVSGMWGFWAFQNDQFKKSVEYMDTSFIKPTMIYGSCDNVVIYDSSLFEIPAGYVAPESDESYIRTEADNYIEAMIPELILAKDDDTFNTMYDEFWKQLDDIGLRKYDAFIDIAVQANCEAKGVTLNSVN